MISAFVFSFLLSGAAQTTKVNIRKKIKPPSVEETYSGESQEKTNDLATYFKENNCTEILNFSKDRSLTSLKPLELAVVASCDPPGKDPEKMFAYAEKRAPDDDAILLLHGRYRWKKFKISATEVWEKLARQTKSIELRQLAEQYLDGNGDKAEEALAVFDKRANFFELGFIRESNPEQLAISDPTLAMNWSDGMVWKLISTRKTDYDFGFMDWTTTLSGTQYNTASDANSLSLEISPVLALQSTLEQFFLLRPIANVSGNDGRLFYAAAGISIGELWQYLSSEYKLLFSIYGDRYYQLGLEGQSGTHYLIEQKSNFKWNSSLISLNLFWDKTNSGEDNSVPLQSIPFTNNSGGFVLSYQWTVKRLTLGINATYSVRQDELDTQFVNARGFVAQKKRRETSTNTEPWISWKFNNDLTAVIFHSSNRVDSNFTLADAYDRNIDDSVTGLVLKTSF